MSVGEYDRAVMAKLQVLLGERGRENPDAALRRKDIATLQSSINRANALLANTNNLLGFNVLSGSAISVLADTTLDPPGQVLAEGATSMPLASYRGSPGAWENPLVFTITARAQVFGELPTRLAFGIMVRDVGELDWSNAKYVGKTILVQHRYDQFVGASYVDQPAAFDDAPNIPREWALWVARAAGEFPCRIADIDASIQQINR
jgi:hypothetical protein